MMLLNWERHEDTNSGVFATLETKTGGVVTFYIDSELIDMQGHYSWNLMIDMSGRFNWVTETTHLTIWEAMDAAQEEATRLTAPVNHAGL